MKPTYRALVSENPMLVEIARFRRKFLNPTGSGAMSGVLITLFLVVYAGLLMLVFSSRGLMDPIAIVIFQTFVFILIAPAMLYGSIAGEREKRTWDLLLVAPITPGQIVVGKFIGALCAFGVGFLFFLVPVLMCALTFSNTNWWNLMEAELVSLTFTIMLSALTIFFSARSKRGFMALGLVLGLNGIILLVIPVLTTSMMDSWTSGLINTLHPFFALANLMDASNRNPGYSPDFNRMDPTVWGVPQIIGYVLLTIVFVVWSIKTLTFAENDVKFIPKDTTHA